MAAGLPSAQRRADRRDGCRSWRKCPARSGTFRSRLPTTWRRRSAASRASWRSRSTATICKTLEEKGDEIVRRHARRRRHRGPRALSRARPAESELHGRSRRSRALPDQRRRCAGRDSDRRRRQRPHPGAAGRAALRPGAALSAAVPRTRRKPSRIFGSSSPSGERVSLAQLCTVQVDRRRLGNLSRGKSALRRHQIQRARPRPGQRGRRGHGEGAASR